MNKLSHSIPDGYELTEHGVFPKEWDIKAIGEIASVSSGGTPNRKVKDFWDGDIPWVTTTLINGNDISYANEFITKKGLESSSAKMCKAGSILMAMYGQGKTRGKAGVLTIDASINQACAAIEVNSSDSGEYILHTLNYMYEDIRELSNSGGQENLSSGIIKGIKLPLPSKSEQTAIANALSDVDALLTELEKLIAKKQAIKTATMQQLLTGTTRLPQFATFTEGAVEGKSQGQPKGTKPSELGEIPEDWDVDRIGDVSTVDPQNLGAGTSPDYEFEYISLEQVDNGKLIGTTQYKFQDAPSRARRVLKHNDVLLSTVRPNLKSHLFIRDKVKNLICSTGFAVIRSGNIKLCSEFIFHHLFCHVINNQIEMLISGSNYPAINSNDVKNLKIAVPPIEEQTAIATILSDMDNEIQTLGKRLAKTRQIKQGMMQELLTGRTRLPFEKE